MTISRNARAVALAAATIVLAAGCSAPSKDDSYSNINDLANAYKQAAGDGIECSESKTDITKNGWDQTTCGPTSIVMMFTSDAKREEIKTKNPLESGRRWIQGANWLIEGDQYEIEKAHKVLGGEIIS